MKGSHLYRIGILIGVATVIVIASSVLYNFNAIEQVKLSVITPLLDELRSSPPPASLSQEAHRANLLIEYQIAESLPSSLFPIPGWLKALGASRIFLLAIELYTLLQPTLKVPKIPDVVRRLIKAD